MSVTSQLESQLAAASTRSTGGRLQGAWRRRRAGGRSRPKAGQGARAGPRPPRAGAATELAERIERLTVLSHRRWGAPILAELLRGDSVPGGAKFITLANRLRLSRDSLSATLEYLIHHDLVMRNPGYGHPMRPEYILADAGYELAPVCRRLLDCIKAADISAIAQRKWGLPAIMAMGRGASRFGQLKSQLPAITSRALTIALKDLVASALVERRVTESFPPAAAYRLTTLGRRVLTILEGM